MTVGFALVAGAVGLPLGLVASFASLCVLSSVFVAHELSRALWARALGRSSRVFISATGSSTEVSGMRLVGSSAAALACVGSLANMVIAAAALALAERGATASGASFLRALAFCHAAWGVGQLLPLVPFRAGTELARKLRPPQRLVHAVLSVACVASAGLVSVASTKTPLVFSLFSLLAIACGRSMGETYRESLDERVGLQQTMQAIHARLLAGDSRACARAVRDALTIASSRSMREKLWRMMAWAALAENDPFLTHAALQQLPPGAVDLHLLTSYLCCCGRSDEALALLEEARSQGQRAPETTKLLIDLLFRASAIERAIGVAWADRALLSAEDWSAIQRAVSIEARSPTRSAVR